VYTSLIYGGPGLPGRIAETLFALLRRDGYSRLSEVIRASLRS